MLASSEVKVSFPGVAALCGCGQLLAGIKYLPLETGKKAEPENFLGLKNNPDLVKTKAIE